ncbi:rhomboid family intramembrane serine protease [Neobacillus sp. DY30]|nr:rhomboid family intramembrane serine protease [Neobacillus sp. DY30]WHX99316.1 rhomboid family intramembrane serine protease [Neobacillus sp. DY30]
MNHKEDYIYWRLAFFFISEQGYRIIQLFENQKELWLEKLENKKAPIVRLLRKDFDWSNAMQRDIEFTAANGEKVRKQLGRRELSIVNIYVSQFPPVDEYEFRLKHPFFFPQSNKTSVSSVLLSDGQFESGLNSLSTRLDMEVSFDIQDEYSEQDVNAQKKVTIDFAKQMAKKEKEIFTNGKPFFTYVFMIFQVAVFLLLELQGGSTNTSTLIKFGAKFNPYIYEGEWWRFITPIFLHIGFLHLAMNTLALYFLGPAVERIFGNIRFLVIYLFAGIAGVIASFIYSPNISAGASGAIFGCFGALLYFAMIYPKLFFRTMGPSVITVLVFNLIFGFTVSIVDNAGHLGGLAGGFLAAGIVHFPKKKRPILQLLFLLISAAIIYGSLFYGFRQSETGGNESSTMMLAQEYIKQENYEQAYDVLTKYAESNKPSAEVYFALSFIEIKLGELKEAKSHLLKVIELDPDLPEAYYNLALIYLEENDILNAKENAEKAVELRPNQQQYTELVQELNRLLPSSDAGE